MLFLMSFLPSFRITHWSVKIFDYIRIQVLFVQLIVLIVSLFFFSEQSTLKYLSQFFLLISISYQLFIILPYVPLKFRFKETEADNYETIGHEVSVLSANVLQKNNDYHKLIDLIRRVDPDILLTTESNKSWEEALGVIEKDFSSNYKIALENRYGMHFYTKLKSIEIKEHYLLSEQSPSIEAHLIDKNNNNFVFWGVHPPPPSPTEKTTSRYNDAELMKLAKLIRKDGFPSIVTGDFNDVCWSRSSKLFAKVSKLRDVRIGRGILGTFPVKPVIFRFPIDLIFSSKEIQVNTIKILSDIGSDHLPIFSKFDLASSSYSTTEKLDSNLKKEINQIIKEGHNAVQDD